MRKSITSPKVRYHVPGRSTYSTSVGHYVAAGRLLLHSANTQDSCHKAVNVTTHQPPSDFERVDADCTQCTNISHVTNAIAPNPEL